MRITLLAKWKYLHAVIADPDLHAPAKVVGYRLLWHHNSQTNRCNPSYATLAEGIGRSRNQAMQAALELEEKGWIKIVRADDNTRGLPSNSFQICWDRADGSPENGTRGGHESRTTPSHEVRTTPSHEVPTTPVKEAELPSPDNRTTGSHDFNTPPSHEVRTQNNESRNNEGRTSERNGAADTRKGASRQGTRLAAAWQPSGNDFQFALDEGLSHEEVHRETDRFRDYWIGANGSKALKRDWAATWRNWIRRTADGRRGHDQARRNPGRSWFGASGALDE